MGGMIGLRVSRDLHSQDLPPCMAEMLFATSVRVLLDMRSIFVRILSDAMTSSICIVPVAPCQSILRVYVRMITLTCLRHSSVDGALVHPVAHFFSVFGIFGNLRDDFVRVFPLRLNESIEVCVVRWLSPLRLYVTVAHLVHLAVNRIYAQMVSKAVRFALSSARRTSSTSSCKGPSSSVVPSLICPLEFNLSTSPARRPSS